MLTLFGILIGYLAADLFVGLYHLFTDRGWNVPQQVKAFREHHDGTVVFDLKPVYFALPVVAIGLFLKFPAVVSFAACCGVSELTHYAAHYPNKSRLARLLQRAGLILNPAAHASHHDGVFGHSFCVFSGWTNAAVDLIARFVPERGP
ncbi:MAG TPA: fatty acid desaturase CarF family protein [Pirellulales bacterium]